MGYFVKGPGNLSHNGVHYGPGDEVADLSPDEAEALLEFGVVSDTKPDDSEVVTPGVTPNITLPEVHKTDTWREELPESEISHPAFDPHHQQAGPAPEPQTVVGIDHSSTPGEQHIIEQQIVAPVGEVEDAPVELTEEEKVEAENRAAALAQAEDERIAAEKAAAEAAAGNQPPTPAAPAAPEVQVPAAPAAGTPISVQVNKLD